MTIHFKVTKKNHPVKIDSSSELIKALNRVSRKGNMLLDLMHQFAKSRSLTHLYNLACEKSIEIFNLETCSVYLVDQERKNLVSVSSCFKTKEANEKFSKLALMNKVPLSTQYLVTKSFLENKTLVEEKNIPSSLKKLGIKTVITAPLLVRGEAIGVFCMRGGKNYQKSDEDVRIAQLLALHLAVKQSNINLLQNLKKEKDKLEVVQNSVKEGLSLHGADGVIYYANPIVGHFFGNTRSTIGVKREELVKNWEKYHKYKIERFYDVEQMRKQVYEEKKPFTGGLMKILSSPVRFVEANYYPVKIDGEFGGLAASYRDITKEKKQEEELEKRMSSLKVERDRWEAIFENVDEGICLLDKDLNILHMNTACESKTGWSSESAVGEKYHKVFKCHTTQGFYYPDFNPLSKLIVTKEPLPYEEHIHTNVNGEENWVGISATPVLNNEGEIKEIILVIRDISLMKEVEKAKSEFVSIASHELRTPLTVVNGYLSLLLSGDLGDFTDQASRDRLTITLRKVANETQRLTNLVSDLLNVSRIEENRIFLNPSQNSIREVILDVYDELKGVAAEKNIKLELADKEKSNGLTAYFDRTKIHQVLINLIDNAIKFTPENGVITLSYWTEGGYVYVAIEDNGIGIPKRLLGNIFEKFQQVPGSYLKENRGTGLGLFIVKSLVEMHKGKLSVESEVGRGSKFIFSLPSAVA